MLLAQGGGCALLAYDPPPPFCASCAKPTPRCNNRFGAPASSLLACENRKALLSSVPYFLRPIVLPVLSFVSC